MIHNRTKVSRVPRAMRRDSDVDQALGSCTVGDEMQKDPAFAKFTRPFEVMGWTA